MSEVKDEGIGDLTRKLLRMIAEEANNHDEDGHGDAWMLSVVTALGAMSLCALAPKAKRHRYLKVMQEGIADGLAVYDVPGLPS